MAYIGFEALKDKFLGKGMKNPGGLAATIGRKKYGTKKFNSAAKKGKKLGRRSKG